MSDLLSVLRGLFGGNGSLGPLPFGAPDITGLAHNGVDYILPAGTPINTPIQGTVVVNQGPTIAIQTITGQILSFWHLIPNPNIPVGTTIGAGTLLGNVDYLTGSPYYRNGIAAYSSTPHVHIAVDSTVGGAVSDTGGVNPLGYLSQLYGQLTGGVGITATSPPQGTLTPGGGNVAMNPVQATGNALGQFGNLMTTIFGGPNIPTSTQEAQSALTGGFTTILKGLADSFGKYAIIGGLIVLAVLVFLELFKGGTTVVMESKQ